jgi:DNA mismatch endonuclease (patch repair protein)
MRSVKSHNTSPELLVRKVLSRAGYGYRLHRADLPGKPDIVFAGRQKVIFVHGCFWHGHTCARGARVPKTNRAYWTAKIARNKTRDATTAAQLKSAGWQALVLWECELKQPEQVAKRLIRFLGALHGSG